MMMADVKKSKLIENTTGIPIKDACIVIVKTAWNAAIVDELEMGCRKVLETHGVQQIISITVPGAVEIPFGVRMIWESRSKKNKPLAFITLGCVIRGGTPHFEYVCRSVTDGVLQLNLQLPVPVIFGVLTVENEEQAKERSGGIHGHKGEESALTAMQMIVLQQQLKKNKGGKHP